jgi:hypothetical protein
MWLKDNRCLKFGQIQLLDTPVDMESNYDCIWSKKAPSTAHIRHGHFVLERMVTLHGLYEEDVKTPDFMRYPSCFYEDLGVRFIVIIQGISLPSGRHALGRSSGRMGIIECSVLDTEMTFHHEIFHMMVKKKIFQLDVADDEEKLAERYAKLVVEHMKVSSHVIPVKYILSNLK